MGRDPLARVSPLGAIWLPRIVLALEGVLAAVLPNGLSLRLATFDGPARAIRAAHSIMVGLDGLGLQARIGLHVGECEVHDGKPSGLAVNIGARVVALATAGEVLVTRTVRDLVAGSGLDFSNHGTHQLQGVPGEWQLFTATTDNAR
jgi:class 3 adenylate cyclase